MQRKLQREALAGFSAHGHGRRARREQGSQPCSSQVAFSILPIQLQRAVSGRKLQRSPPRGAAEFASQKITADKEKSPCIVPRNLVDSLDSCFHFFLNRPCIQQRYILSFLARFTSSLRSTPRSSISKQGRISVLGASEASSSFPDQMSASWFLSKK